MAKAISSWLRSSDAAAFIRHGLRGLEKESLRVDARGRLSKRPHPPAIGAALTHPYITTDYSEALLEIVTPPFTSNWELLQFLCDLHAFVQRKNPSEQLWPASMPCVLDPEHSIPIAQYGRSNPGRVKTVYRHGLGHRYGRAMQAIAGVHFNYSLPPALWQHWHRESGRDVALSDFKSERYMGLVRNFRRLSWLTIYLFGASPACCKSFAPQGQPDLEALDPSTWFGRYATSLRMSDLGYRNGDQARLTISANSLPGYVQGLRRALTTPDAGFAALGVKVDGEYRQLNSNVLQIENEYYSSVRPKPAKTSIERPVVALEQRGIEYVEIRTLDLGVADPVGINQSQLRFLEALLIYCLLADSPPIEDAEQSEIAARELLAAKFGRQPGLRLPRDGGQIGLSDWGLAVLDSVAAIAAALDQDGEGYLAAVELQRAALNDPGQTPSARFIEALTDQRRSFFDYVLDLSASHREYFLGLPVNAEQESAFEQMAADSLAAARALEAQAQIGFDEYLAAQVNLI